MAAPLALIVTVEIDPARLDEFIEVMRVDCAGSRKEEGCYRFDLLRDTAQANKFVFYEVYKEPLPQARAHTARLAPHHWAGRNQGADFSRTSVLLLRMGMGSCHHNSLGVSVWRSKPACLRHTVVVFAAGFSRDRHAQAAVTLPAMGCIQAVRRRPFADSRKS